ncbi:uncharacterized protein LOC119134078 [Syngnathus acus]|uniref:uncharacterized protein LOC119134078 n=1 Tax=Syngnathus acus TaxID=161584 RepID=UPI001885B559|nr:uncharacterized protein LOC119134078 [Syngnathus acus]
MSETHNNVGLAQAEDFAEVISGSHIVLERSPPDYVRKISQYIECSAGPSNQNPEVESDSGDSLFITQLPVPQPVRKVRRRKSSRHPFKDRRGDSSSTHSDDDDRETSRKTKKKRKIHLPKYNFPFLTERKGKPRCTRLTTKQNHKFHNYAMGGFFKCVELWQGAEDLYEGLPTVDQDNEDISPLTEDEDKSGDEDLKVVAKNLFLAKSKAQRCQPWYTPAQEEGVVTREREKIVQISNKVPTSSMLSAKDKTDETHSASTCNDPAVPGNNKALRKIPRSRRTRFQELADVETRSKRVPFKEHIASEEESDWQSREGEDADITVTMETTLINAQAPLDLHENRMDNFSYVTSTPRKKDKRSKGHGVASGQREKNTRQEIELERDLGVKDNAVCSLSRDEPEVEEFSDVVSEPLRDESRRKKKKKKRSHQEPGSLGMNEKSSNRTAPLNGSTEKNVADTTEDKDVQLVRKKKKKKRKLSTTFPEVNESMSEVENQNNRTSSFLLADVEESSAFEARLHKKHKKKKLIGHKGAEDASGDSSHYNLPVKVVPKGQKRQHDSQVATNEDRPERAVDSAFLKPHEAKVKKKKKKKKHHDHWETEETLPFENEESRDLNSSLHQSHYAENSTEKSSLDTVKKKKHKKHTHAHQMYN